MPVPSPEVLAALRATPPFDQLADAEVAALASAAKVEEHADQEVLLDAFTATPRHVFVVVAGEVALDGEDLLAKTPSEMRAIRGRDIAMIFQEPMTSLTPVHRIGRQIAEPLVLHRGLS